MSAARQKGDAFLAALREYVQGQLNAVAYRRDELRQFQALHRRLAATRATLLAGDIRWARANPGADVTLGVRNLIFFVSIEMEEGCCLLSAGRIGEVYERHHTTIRGYLKALKETGLLAPRPVVATTSPTTRSSIPSWSTSLPRRCGSSMPSRNRATTVGRVKPTRSLDL